MNEHMVFFRVEVLSSKYSSKFELKEKRFERP